MKTARNPLAIFLFFYSFFLDAQKVELILPVGHQREVLNAIFSPDQKLIYTASADNTISVWDANTGNEVRKLRGHTGAVNDIAVSANGKYLVSASDDGKALLWNTTNGKVLHMLPQNYIPVKQVAISPLTNFVVTGGYSAEMKSSVISIWNLPNGTESKTINYPNERILSIALSLSKKEILILTDVGILYEIDGNTLQQTSHDLKIKPELAVFDKEAATVAVSRDHTVTLFAISSYEKLGSFVPESDSRITSIQFSRDGNDLFLGCTNGGISLFQIAGSKFKSSFNNHLSTINGISLSADGKYLLSASSDHSACIVEIASGINLHRLEGKSIAVNDFSLLRSDQRILSLFGDSSLKEWNIMDRISIARLMNFDSEQRFMDASEDGNKVITTGSNTSQLIDPETKKTIYATDPKLRIKNGVISPDGKWIVTIDESGSIRVSSTPGMAFSTFGKVMKQGVCNELSIDKNNNLLVSEKGNLKLYNLETGKLIHNFSVNPDSISAFAYSKNMKYYAMVTSVNTIRVFSPDTDTALFKIEIPMQMLKAGIFKIAFSNNGNYFAFNTPDNLIQLVDIAQRRIIHNYYGHTDQITNIRFTGDGNYLMSSSMDHTIRLWQVKLNIEEAKTISHVTSSDFSYSSVVLSKYDPSAFTAWNSTPTQFEQASFIALKNDDWIITTPDRYYFCNKGAAKDLGYSKNGKYFSFEQFDLKYNRPDIVLKRIGIRDSALIDAYKKAYEKRLRKMGFTEDQLNDDLNLPEIKIKNFEFLPIETDSEELNFNLELKDDKYPLNRLSCWVNGVAIFGKNGLNLADQNARSLQKNLAIRLSPGMNNIRFAVLNAKGAESYKASANIRYTPRITPGSTLYLIALSVSEYTNTSMNLRYSVKDGRDLVRNLAAQKGFDRIIIDTFFNKSVTKEITALLKEKLSHSKINDEVILFVSGHGMLDEKLDFYFASCNMDFSIPNKQGISYDALEDMLDSIPARKKLLLMDACHSGELDKEENMQLKNKNEEISVSANIKIYEARGAQLLVGDSKIGLQNSFEMMQELFAGVNKGSGAVVISAAAGKGFAFESPRWNNGVFTYCIMNGILTKNADTNKDNMITAKELLEYVSTEVERLTNGAQKPTSRKENFEYDWVVWKY